MRSEDGPCGIISMPGHDSLAAYDMELSCMISPFYSRLG